MRLIDATPFLYVPLPDDGWMFQYGKGLVGQECGAVYVTKLNPRYVRFKVIEQDGKPLFQRVSERLLTDEERKHFETLVEQVAQAELGTTPDNASEDGRYF